MTALRSPRGAGASVHLHGDPVMNAPSPLTAPLTRLGEWTAVGSNRVRFLRDGAVAFPATLEAIAGAKWRRRSLPLRVVAWLAAHFRARL